MSHLKSEEATVPVATTAAPPPNRAAWVRLAKWSLSRRLLTCLPTVRSLITKLPAISSFTHKNGSPIRSGIPRN